jgi:molybdopterin-guanine dinucleotide biosynthesis protein A
MGASFLLSKSGREPAFCMLRVDCGARLSTVMDGGARRLDEVLLGIDGDDGDSWVEARSLARYAERAPSELEIEQWFFNINTPNDLEVAKAWSE